MLGNDPGAQPERTALAWQRSAMACAMIALLAGFGSIKMGGAPLTIVVGIVAVVVVINLFRGFPTGAMPGSGQLHSYPLLRRIALQAAALGVVGAAMAVVQLVSGL